MDIVLSLLTTSTSTSTTTHKPHRQYHRHRIEVINQILTAVSEYPEGISKTHIIFKAFVNNSQLKLYMPYLIDNDLLTASLDESHEHASKPRELYHLTTKGQIFLKLYTTMNSQDIVWDSLPFRPGPEPNGKTVRLKESSKKKDKVSTVQSWKQSHFSIIY
jgi:predicted transcriptional regulator